MENQEQRDIAEEEYNRRTCPECDGQHELDEPCKDGLYGISNELDISDYPARDTGKWSESDELTQTGSFRDEWDGSARNQTYDMFIGKSGYVTILWGIINNPYEKYDGRRGYHMPALDWSALYVTCSLHFTYPDAYSTIERVREDYMNMCVKITVHHL